MDLFCYLCFIFIFVMLSFLYLADLWSPAGSLVCDVLLCFCHYFSIDIPGQVWYLIVSIPNLCLPLYRSIKKVISLRNISIVFSHFYYTLWSMIYNMNYQMFLPFCFYKS